jgi:hypothetical protein
MACRRLFPKVISWPLRELQHPRRTPLIHLDQMGTKICESRLSAAPAREGVGHPNASVVNAKGEDHRPLPDAPCSAEMAERRPSRLAESAKELAADAFGSQ